MSKRENLEQGDSSKLLPTETRDPLFSLSLSLSFLLSVASVIPNGVALRRMVQREERTGYRSDGSFVSSVINNGITSKLSSHAAAADDFR